MSPMNPRLLRPKASGGFDPRSIGSLAIWLDATSASTLTFNYDNTPETISEWRDKSGNGFHFSQGTSNNQPRYTGSINGLPAVLFDGTDDGLDRTGAASASVADSTGACAFIAYEISGTESVYSLLRTHTTTVGHDRFSNGLNYHAYFRARFSALANPAPATGRNLLTSSGVVATDLHSFRINGSTIQSQPFASTFATWRTLTNQTWSVGYELNSFFGGSIGEVLVYGKALSASQIATVENYLAQRWGITLS